MLKDIIEARKAVAREEIHGWTVNVLEHEIERAYIKQFVDDAVAETAQIVAREVREQIIIELEERHNYVNVRSTLDTYLPLEESLLNDEEINIPGFEGTREDLDKIKI